MENANKEKRRLSGPVSKEAEQEAERLFDESRHLLTQAGNEPDPAKRRAMAQRSHELGEQSARLQRVAAKMTGGAVSTADVR